MKNNCPLESIEQAQFCDYLDDHNILYTSTQNGAFLGGRNSFAQYNKLKKTGTKKGFPDLIIFVRNESKTESVLFIEMKRQKGGIVSKDQKEWLHKLDKAGYSVGVAKGCIAAIRMLNKYLNT